MILTDEELLRVLKHGLWTKLKKYGDEEFTHYVVLAFSEDELLICFSGISWKDGSTWYIPHRISQRGKNKVWFFENPEETVEENKKGGEIKC